MSIGSTIAVKNAEENRREQVAEILLEEMAKFVIAEWNRKDAFDVVIRNAVNENSGNDLIHATGRFKPEQISAIKVELRDMYFDDLVETVKLNNL